MKNLIKKYKEEIDTIELRMSKNPQKTKLDNLEYSSDKAIKGTLQFVVKDLEKCSVGTEAIDLEQQVIKKPIKFTECYIGQKMGFDVIINTEVPPNEIHFIDENGNEVLVVRNVSL